MKVHFDLIRTALVTEVYSKNIEKASQESAEKDKNNIA